LLHAFYTWFLISVSLEFTYVENLQKGILLGLLPILGVYVLFTFLKTFDFVL
jgi:cation:H+ antiporter